jgi:thymidine phosphorylase
MGLLTQDEVVVILRTDSPVARAEGLAPRSQVLLCAGERQVYATLFQVQGDIIGLEEAALSESAWALLAVEEGDLIQVRHPPALESLAGVRRRIYGQRLDQAALSAIVNDVVAGRYMDVHLAAFLTAASTLPLDDAETTSLTRAMAQAGDVLSWSSGVVVDKHCVGGLPGNRTTPIVVAIVTATGLVMPKTSSRAITSPAGTADTMETLAPVDLSLADMRRVVESQGGCIAWGGAMRLSPADDIFIRVERVLDVDTEGQLIASVISKKLAAGVNRLVLDIPVGPTAKVRSEEAGRALAARMEAIAAGFGLQVRCLLTDGAQPVGRGIGPALEAIDVLAVLRNEPGAPADLRRRACRLAGEVLEMGGVASPGAGLALAQAILADGRAWTKFQGICQAQGGIREPPVSKLQRLLKATRSGRVVHLNNRKLARLAKLAGAPAVKAAGLFMHVRLGDEVGSGGAVATVHADTAGELDYALDYAAANPDIVEIEA